MTDGTFDLAVVEGYSYTGGPPYPPAPPVPHYYPALNWARSHGYINRTIFCFGWILGRSQWHPDGWTNQSLRAAVRMVKAAYPALAGIAMYGRPPAHAADTATVALIRYASQLMLEEYPDARTKTDDSISGSAHLAGFNSPPPNLEPLQGRMKPATAKVTFPSGGGAQPAWVRLDRADNQDDNSFPKVKLKTDELVSAPAGKLSLGDYTVVVAADASPGELFAAQELANIVGNLTR